MFKARVPLLNAPTLPSKQKETERKKKKKKSRVLSMIGGDHTIETFQS